MSPIAPAPISHDQAAEIARVFAVLADPTRLRILHALAQDEHNTSELAAAVGVSDSAISHQLRSLRHQRLISSRRDGKQIWHQLADDHVRSLIDQSLDHARESDAFQ